MLVKYRALNPDLPRTLVHQLAIFVLAPYVGKDALEELFARPLGQTPWRHRSWLWGKALRASNMGHLADEFFFRYNTGQCLHCTLKWVREQTSKENWMLLSNRLGTPLKGGRTVLNPNWWRHKDTAVTTEYWTSSGVWSRADNFGKIIGLGEHIIREESEYNTATRRLTPALCHRLEREIHNLFGNDSYLVPDAIHEAVQYVRKRIPAMLNYKRDTVGYKTVSWFFQRAVPHPAGGQISWKSEARYPMRKRDIIEWLPKIKT